MGKVFKFPVPMPNGGKNILAEAECCHLSLITSWWDKNNHYQPDMNRISCLTQGAVLCFSTHHRFGIWWHINYLFFVALFKKKTTFHFPESYLNPIVSKLPFCFFGEGVSARLMEAELMLIPSERDNISVRLTGWTVKICRKNICHIAP